MFFKGRANHQYIKIKRHSLIVRVTHWINAICLTFLLMTGLQIFNAHPHLHIGVYGADADPSVMEIDSRGPDNDPQGYLRIGALRIPTTGVLGVSKRNGEIREIAFPSWATLPGYRDLAAGRRWHFFFAWLFVFNGIVYLLNGFLSKHFARDLTPASDQLTGRHLLQEISDHARLRFPKGDGARRYNTLQKLAYLAVIFILLPLMVLTGLTMSPGLDAAFPLADMFGGRPTARTIHFIVATLLVGFVIIHLFMVLVSRVWNNLRSMLTGNYLIERDGKSS